MTAAQGPGGGVPFAQIVVGGILLGLHKDEKLDPELVAAIEQGNQFVLDIARALAGETAGLPSFTGTDIKGLAEHLERITGMTLQELGERFGLIPPRVTEGGPVLVTGSEDLHTEFTVLADFISTESFPLPDLLHTLAQLLLNPAREPGEPCLAPAPLLRDLLDLALGRVGGVLSDTVLAVGSTIQDLLIPAFAEGQALDHFIQAVLDDPITAALNLVLGQRDKIDCEVAGGLGAAAGVIETGIRRLTEAVEGAFA